MENKKERILSCVDCGKISCGRMSEDYPQFCLTKGMSKEERAEIMPAYEEEEVNKIMMAAAQVEYECYGKMNRVKETMEFARKIGAKKLGIAVCSGLYREGQILADMLRSNGCEVYGAICKVGAVKKTDIGIPEECEKTGKTMCNPIMQAKILNREKTDLNILVGLCVGHDSLFYRNSEAPVTTLVVKDRVMGHNPVNALYTSKVYGRDLYGDNK